MMLSGPPGLLSGKLCGPHGSLRRCLMGRPNLSACAADVGGGVGVRGGVEHVHLCLRVLDRHVFVVDGDAK